MEIIEVNTNIYPNIGAHICASDECAIALKQLGMEHCFSVKGQRGSHGAEVWVSTDKKEFFEKEILHKTIKGTYRTFFFSICTPYGCEYTHYYVSYRKN